jgi:hypothetical protein
MNSLYKAVQGRSARASRNFASWSLSKLDLEQNATPGNHLENIGGEQAREN